MEGEIKVHLLYLGGIHSQVFVLFTDPKLFANSPGREIALVNTPDDQEQVIQRSSERDYDALSVYSGLQAPQNLCSVE